MSLQAVYVVDESEINYEPSDELIRRTTFLFSFFFVKIAPFSYFFVVLVCP